MSAIDNQIEAQRNRIAVLDARIGRLMSQRVSLEDKLAGLYERQSGQTPLRKALDTILAPDFGE